MAIKEYTLNSLGGYLDLTREIRKTWPQETTPERTGDEQKLWFRGQRCWQWAFRPSCIGNLTGVPTRMRFGSSFKVMPFNSSLVARLLTSGTGIF